jgi:hypothetical protein
VIGHGEEQIQKPTNNAEIADEVTTAGANKKASNNNAKS